MSLTTVHPADTDAPILDVLAERWSTRIFDAQTPIDEEALASELEAARWAPSANNTQPWRFVVARRGTGAHAAIVAALMGFNQTWILLNNVLPVAKEKYGGFDPEAIRKAALDVDIPPGGTIQGYGVKFYPPGAPMAGQNERSTPVVMQNAGERITVVWPTNIRTQDPVFPLPKGSVYGA